MLHVVRDLMLYATEGIGDPYEKAKVAATVIDFYANATSEEGAYGTFLRSYNKSVQMKLDGTNSSQYASVLHDELEDINEPIYFRELVARAEAHGLQYMCDTDFSISTGSRIPDEVSSKLEQPTGGDRVALEQYADFLACRTFRRSLLCHREVRLSQRLVPAAVMRLKAASDAQPASEQPDLYALSTEKFEVPADKAAISTNHPVSKIAMTLLAAVYPQPIPFGELLAEARARIAEHRSEAGGDGPSEDEDVDAEALGVQPALFVRLQPEPNGTACLGPPSRADAQRASRGQPRGALRGTPGRLGHQRASRARASRRVRLLPAGAPGRPARSAGASGRNSRRAPGRRPA